MKKLRVKLVTSQKSFLNDNIVKKISFLLIILQETHIAESELLI